MGKWFKKISSIVECYFQNIQVLYYFSTPNYQMIVGFLKSSVRYFMNIQDDPIYWM